MTKSYETITKKVKEFKPSKSTARVEGWKIKGKPKEKIGEENGRNSS